MFPWFHPNFPFETLLLRTWSNHHKSKLVNLSTSGGIFPSSFKRALSTLFSKNIFIHWYLYNFRLNSNPNFISKIFENVVASRIQSHLSSNSLSSSFQFAYRIVHSNESTLLKIHNGHILAMDLGEDTSLILLDLSAALDILSIIPSFSLVLISSPFLLSSSVNQWFHIPSLHSLLSPVVYPKVPYWVYSFSFSIQLLLALWSKKSLKYYLYADTLMKPSCTM